MFIDVHNRPMVNITLECLEFYEEKKNIIMMNFFIIANK